MSACLSGEWGPHNTCTVDFSPTHPTGPPEMADSKWAPGLSICVVWSRGSQKKSFTGAGVRMSCPRRECCKQTQLLREGSVLRNGGKKRKREKNRVVPCQRDPNRGEKLQDRALGGPEVLSRAGTRRLLCGPGCAGLSRGRAGPPARAANVPSAVGLGRLWRRRSLKCHRLPSSETSVYYKALGRLSLSGRNGRERLSIATHSAASGRRR